MSEYTSKTQEEVKKQIAVLIKIKPKVPQYSAFGDDHWAAIDAQIKVLEEDMDNSDIENEFELEEGVALNIVTAALDARQWIDGESEEDDLAEDYPLTE